ncbi:MAG: ATP-binding cassette domain-containing protein [Candidatus Kariarchaeaceae archaeon]
MGTIVSVNDLSMTYRSKIRRGFFKSELKEVDALRKISLKIEEGTIFGLLGPNGAGKTTLIKCLTTLLIPSEGTAFVNGYDIRDQEKDVRASIGAMLMGERGLYWKLTARENLDYFAQLYSVPKELRKPRIDALIDQLELTDFVDRAVESYSSGQRMKVAFAKALVNDPPIIFLDEPTIAMDVHGARKLRSIVKSLPESGKTVIYTTHLMAEAAELCDEIAIIDKGEIIVCDTPEGIVKRSKGKKSIHVEGIISDVAIEKIRDLDGVKEAVVSGSETEKTKVNIIVKDTAQTLPSITNTLVQANASIEVIKSQEPNLEDVFIELTGRSLTEDTREEQQA